MAGRKAAKTTKKKEVIVTDEHKAAPKPAVKELTLLDKFHRSGGSGRRELDALIDAICDKIGL